MITYIKKPSPLYGDVTAGRQGDTSRFEKAHGTNGAHHEHSGARIPGVSHHIKHIVRGYLPIL